MRKPGTARWAPLRLDLLQLAGQGLDQGEAGVGIDGVQAGKVVAVAVAPGGRHVGAAAAVGQCELMHIYDDMFSKYNVTVAQILLTRATLTNERLPHVQNTIGRLLEMGVIPIVNENDTVAIDELELEIGENDSLSATVAAAVGADLLIILSDINGLYSADPRTDANAQVIREVRKIDARIEQMAGGAGSALGSGGMATKINAAKIATEAGVDMVIMNGRDPEQLYALFDGEPIGTHFLAE